MICLRAGLSGEISKKYWTAVGAVMRKLSLIHISMKIKKGDTVKVIAGKDNGKEGKVLAVNAKDNTLSLIHISLRYQEIMK